VNLEQIKELMTSLESSKLKKLVLKKGDFELQLEKENEQPSVVHLPPPYQPPSAASFAQQLAIAGHGAEQGKAGQKAVASQPAEVIGQFVKSPMVGTFYSSPSPGQPNFVKVGDRIEEHTVVCIIEAMKVMNEVKAGVQGTVVEILVDSSQPVEFGAKIYRVE
jgi:acetyl-CoA carboxylase biotin carboxyl carrier protein